MIQRSAREAVHIAFGVALAATLGCASTSSPLARPAFNYTAKRTVRPRAASAQLSISARRMVAAAFVIAASLSASAPARGYDGFESKLAAAVRGATERYRLVQWAVLAGYVQSTDYVASYGTTYTNHQLFNPPDLAHPTVLLYDAAGRLAACGYHFEKSAAMPAALQSIPASAWYDIPKHVHYNVVVDGVGHYGQAPWEGDDMPTKERLVKLGYMPAGAVLRYAFVHPATRAVLVWAWLPNENGLFADEDPMLP